MAKPIQSAAPGRALTRRYALVGGLRLELDETIVPVVVVDEVDVGRERWAAGLANEAATPATFSNTQMFNPSRSGILVSLQQIFVSMNAVGQFTCQFHNTALTNDRDLKEWRDRRLPGRPRAETLSELNAASLGIANLFNEFDIGVANDSSAFPIDIELLPGQGVVFTPEVVNRRMRTSFWWSETTLLPGE